MGSKRVLRRDDRCDAALGQVGGGFRYVQLGDDGNGATVGDLQGIGKAGNAAADDQKV